MNLKGGAFMTTIATYSNITEAHIAKGMLESEGIKCQLKNELIAQTLPVGIELTVAESDVESALAILEESDFE